MTDAPFASVVIPTLNEEDSVCACLDAVLAQSCREIEVLVVDGGSTDATLALVEDYAQRDHRVRCVPNPRRTQAAAMNVALGSLRSPYLVRVDAHSTIPTDYVSRILDHFSTGDWGGVGGRKDGVATSRQGRAIVGALSSPIGVGNSTYHHGVSTQTVDHIPFGAYPVALARSIGGWDESILANEDYEFDYRIRQSGHELLFDPQIVIWWQTRERVKDLFAQYRRYGRGKAVVLSKHPESAALRHLIPAGVVIGLAASAAIAPVRPKLAALGIGGYLGLLGIGTASCVDRVPRESIGYVPMSFAAMHLGYGLGLIEQTIGV